MRKRVCDALNIMPIFISMWVSLLSEYFYLTNNILEWMPSYLGYYKTSNLGSQNSSGRITKHYYSVRSWSDIDDGCQSFSILEVKTSYSSHTSKHQRSYQKFALLWTNLRTLHIRYSRSWRCCSWSGCPGRGRNWTSDPGPPRSRASAGWWI